MESAIQLFRDEIPGRGHFATRMCRHVLQRLARKLDNRIVTSSPCFPDIEFQTQFNKSRNMPIEKNRIGILYSEIFLSAES